MEINENGNQPLGGHFLLVIFTCIRCSTITNYHCYSRFLFNGALFVLNRSA